MPYLRDKGGLKAQVHHESQECIYDLSKQVHILLTPGLWKQNKVIRDLSALQLRLVISSPWKWSQRYSYSLNCQCHKPE